MSPLCVLKNNIALADWTDVARDMYGKEEVPDYISSLSSPMRKSYPTKRMLEEEMLTSLTKGS